MELQFLDSLTKLRFLRYLETLITDVRGDKSKHAHKDCERHTETCRTIWWIIHPAVCTADTERVRSDSGGEGSSTFYLEMSEGAALIRKTVDVEGTQFQSILQSQISSLGVRIFRDQIPDDLDFALADG